MGSHYVANVPSEASILDRFLEVVALATELEAKHDPDPSSVEYPRISFDDIRHRLRSKGVLQPHVDEVSELATMYFRRDFAALLGSGSGEGAGWFQELHADVRRFKGVTTFSSYLERMVDLVEQTKIDRNGSMRVGTQPAFSTESTTALPTEPRDIRQSRMAEKMEARPPSKGLDVKHLEFARSVFVVHGRNEQARIAIFSFLRAINLKPLEWSKAVELTRTGAPYIGEVLDAAFDQVAAVVVLLTPDEVVHLDPAYGQGADDPETLPALQARPNVLFEAGMAIGRRPEQTIILELGTLRPFSDIGGRHVIRLSDSFASRQALANRLKTAGCEVDITGTDWHTAGDFSSPTSPR